MHGLELLLPLLVIRIGKDISLLDLPIFGGFCIWSKILHAQWRLSKDYSHGEIRNFVSGFWIHFFFLHGNSTKSTGPSNSIPTGWFRHSSLLLTLAFTLRTFWFRPGILNLNWLRSSSYRLVCFRHSIQSKARDFSKCSTIDPIRLSLCDSTTWKLCLTHGKHRIIRGIIAGYVLYSKNRLVLLKIAKWGFEVIHSPEDGWKSGKAVKK